MRSPVVVLSILAVLAAPPIRADSPQLLGIADVEAGTSTSIGFGGRFDYRLGRSRLVAGAEVDWLYSVSGDSLTVTTAPGSPYSGTVAGHEGVSFVLDLSYYF